MVYAVENPGAGIRPIREGLLDGQLTDLESLALAGTECSKCQEVTLGYASLCPNCGSDLVRHLRLTNEGTVWTYTVARHKPPGDYRGPEPFAPFGIALVELPEGLRLMTRVDCNVATLRIGMPVRFTPFLRHDKDGSLTVTFTYTANVGATS
jgi:uncharacterized OB-fold protein